MISNKQIIEKQFHMGFRFQDADAKVSEEQ
jgi:hypothetical protein